MPVHRRGLGQGRGVAWCGSGLIVNGWLIQTETSVLGFDLGSSGEVDQHGLPVVAGPDRCAIGPG